MSLRPTANRRFNELIGVLLLAAACLLFLALVSYHPADPSPDTAAALARPANWVGPVGAWGADLLFQTFGIAAFLFALGLAASARRWFQPQPPGKRAAEKGWIGPLSRAGGLLLLVVAAGAGLAELPWHALWRSAVPLSGVAGGLAAAGLIRAFSPIGAGILTLTALLTGLFLATPFSFAAAEDWWLESIAPRVNPVVRPILRPLTAPLRALAAWWRRRQEAIAERRRQRASERATVVARRARVDSQFIPARERPVPVLASAASRARQELEERSRTAGGGPETWPDEPEAVAASAPAPPVRLTPPWEDEPGAAAAARENAADVTVSPLVARGRAAMRPKPRPAGQYKLPSPTLLQEPGAGEHVDEAELRELAAALKAKCEEFDVHGQVTQINPGPVVTTYEFKPEAGVKYSRITALNEDLCLALEAESIYIERIPGKSTVGIEVPNRRRETIYLREVVESKEFHGGGSPLTMALGKDINGRMITADLGSMPHLLIAGSTGSGKSVALNSMIVSLLYKSTPDEVRFILVDPKRLELGLYDGIPHLYTPIITEPKLAANALRNATREMERRLKVLAGKGVRNIAQYNQLFQSREPGLFDNLEEDPDNRPLPYIVIIIDELADLMVVDGKNVEESITRLAQMARAVGIHLILATQRPSVDVITGLIKANFPARVSFRVATKVDSRTILDTQGAESLLGKGDMLFLPPGTSRLHRVHGTFVTEKEIAKVVQFWAQQAPPQFDETFLRPPAEEGKEGGGAGGDDGEFAGGEGGGEPQDDPMFEDAVRVVLEYGKASTSLLQRRLRIGYGRAAHLIDLMHADGIVGPADGPKPREVLKRPDWLAEVDEVLR
jgi:S-DNA-T family DNA segregation ATPase FtsK/SpoIIIE